MSSPAGNRKVETFTDEVNDRMSLLTPASSVTGRDSDHYTTRDGSERNGKQVLYKKKATMEVRTTTTWGKTLTRPRVGHFCPRRPKGWQRRIGAHVLHIYLFVFLEGRGPRAPRKAWPPTVGTRVCIDHRDQEKGRKEGKGDKIICRGSWPHLWLIRLSPRLPVPWAVSQEKKCMHRVLQLSHH